VAKKAESVMALLVILTLGALIGSVIGEVIGVLVPGGYVEAIFAQGVSPGITPPAVLDLKVLTLTLGRRCGSTWPASWGSRWPS